MELSGYLGIARRWWWTLLVATWIAGLSGYVLASQVTPTYESRTTLLVGPINADNDTIRASGELVQTYAVLVTSQPVINDVISTTGIPVSPDDLRLMIKAVPNDITRMLTIRVQNSDPVLAANIANAISQRLRELTVQGEVRPEGALTVVDTALPDTQPVAPQVSLLVLLAAAAGLIAALIVVVLLEYLTRTVRSKEDVDAATEAPFLGTARVRAGAGPEPLPVASHPGSAAASDFRSLAAKVAYREDGAPVRSLLVFDARAGGNAVAVAANLAGALALSGDRVVLIDVDSTERGLSEAFGLAPVSPDLLARNVHSVRRRTEIPSLTIVPAILDLEGRPPDIDRIRELVAALLSEADRVVVSAPPIASSGDALAWARIVETVVLTVERDHVRREDVAESVDSLGFVGGRLAGWILTDGRTGRGFSPLGLGRRRDRRRTEDAANVTRIVAVQPSPVDADAERGRASGLRVTRRPRDDHQQNHW